MMTKENIKKVWLTDEAIFVEDINGKIAQEKFSDYHRLKYAAQEQRENYSLDILGIRWEEIDEDLSYEGFFAKKPPLSDIGKVFSDLGELNISAFARRMGISQPLMASYLNGTKRPSEERKKQIEKQLHHLGQELMQVRL